MKKLMAIALAAAWAAPAFAGDFYAGADIGRDKIDGFSQSVNGTLITMQDWKAATYALFGGYTINENLALEVGYRSLGKGSATVLGKTAEMKSSALQLSLVASVPVAQDISLYGRLGVNRIKVTAEYAGNSSSASESKALVGFGAAYALSKQASVRVEFQKLASDVSSLTTGVTFAF